MGRATQIYVDESNRVSSVKEAKFSDPHPQEPNEIIFGMNGINPIRKPIGLRIGRVGARYY